MVFSKDTEEVNDDREMMGKKWRKCPPRCIVCQADAEMSDEKVTVYCSTSLVHLCYKITGQHKSICFERFHQLQDLSSLQWDMSEGIESRAQKQGHCQAQKRGNCQRKKRIKKTGNHKKRNHLISIRWKR